jgi:hypothetical protein
MASTPKPPPTSVPRPSTPSRDRLRGVRRLAGFAGRWTIPIVGGIVPVMLIAVNVAVWINDHVTYVAFWLGIAAFLSGMMLNTWWVLKAYRFFHNRHPDWGIFNPQHEELLLVLGMGGVTIFTFVLAWGVYIGLKDTKHLPNGYTLWWGILQILIPIVAKLFFDRDEERAADRRRTAPAGVPTPSSPPPALRPGAPPPASGTGQGPYHPPTPPGGRVPPPYLPPS